MLLAFQDDNFHMTFSDLMRASGDGNQVVVETGWGIAVLRMSARNREQIKEGNLASP